MISPYAEVALSRACRTVSALQSGTRNNGLNCEALGIGQLVAGGAIGHDNAVESLTQAALQAGLKLKEARATIRSAFHAGAKNPRNAPKNDNARSDAQQGVTTRPQRRVLVPSYPSKDELKWFEDSLRPVTDQEFERLSLPRYARSFGLVHALDGEQTVFAVPIYGDYGIRRSWLQSQNEQTKVLGDTCKGLQLVNTAGVALLRESKRPALFSEVTIEIVVAKSVCGFLFEATKSLDELPIRAVFMPLDGLAFLSRLPSGVSMREAK